MPPTQTLKISAYGQTDRGLMRDENEDNLMLDEFKHVFAVADGLGGLPEGSLASTIAVTRLREYVDQLGINQPADYPKIFSKIQAIVVEEGRTIDDEIGMATTLTIAQIVGDTLHIGHLGDTGVFLFRDNTLQQLTKDHTMAQDIIDKMNTSEQVSIPEYYHHTLTRCIGQIDDLSPDTYEFKVKKKDRLLLYTDGVTKTWKRSELQASFHIHDNPETLVQKIIEVANQRGGPDNITAIAVYID